jgi:hypothetical protein
MNELRYWIIDQLRGGETIENLVFEAGVAMRNGCLSKNCNPVPVELAAMKFANLITIEGEMVRVVPKREVFAPRELQKSLF